MAFFRLMLGLFIVLSVIYIAIVLWSHSVRKAKLSAEWEENPTGARDEFIARGLEEYRGSFRRKLIWLVYIIPLVLIGTIIYVTNFM